MAIEEALTTLLSGVASGRRYWGHAPQTVSPDDGAFLVLNNVTKLRDYEMVGASGYVAARFQIDVYAVTYTAAKTAAESVVSTLSGHKGTTGGVTIQAIFLDGPSSRSVDDTGTVRPDMHRLQMDALIHYIES